MKNVRAKYKFETQNYENNEKMLVIRTSYNCILKILNISIDFIN